MAQVTFCLLGLLNTQYDKLSEKINGATGYSYQVIHLKEMLSAYSYASAFTVDTTITGQGVAPSIGTSTAEDQETLQRLTKEYNRVSAQLAAAKSNLQKLWLVNKSLNVNSISVTRGIFKKATGLVAIILIAIATMQMP